MQVGWKYYILSTSWHKLLNIQYLQFQQIPLEKRVSCYAPILCRKQFLSVLTVERELRDHYQLSLKPQESSSPYPIMHSEVITLVIYAIYATQCEILIKDWLDFLKEIMERMGKNMHMNIFWNSRKTWNLRWGKPVQPQLHLRSLSPQSNW